MASQVGVASQVGEDSPRYHNSQHQDGLASREEASGVRLQHNPSSLSSLNLSSLNLHRHSHSQLSLRLRDPQ